MSSNQAAANVRVLVRVRPLNTAELTENGAMGRINALTINSSSDGRIDFGGSEDKKKKSSDDDVATIVVNNVQNGNTTGGGVGSNGGGAGSDVNRRMTAGSSRNSTDGEGASSSNSSVKQFTVDAVHGTRSTQADVYDSVKGIVDTVVSGYNGTIVAYGQTGSGKTHTVFGDGNASSENSGLVQRSLRDIFHKFTLSQAEAATTTNGEDNESMTTSKTSTSSSSKTTFKASFMEIFNERIYDLLSEDSLERNLAVREDANGVYVESLKEVEVTNTAQAEGVLARGMANRHVAATNMNRTSSRSHAVFVLSIRSEHVNSEGLRKIRNSKFTLVDLAGSERQKSTAAFGERLKEASMINKSLLCLGHVINALADREGGRVRHIPFRNSKLTFLLRDTWGGNSKTCLVATVSPSASALSETTSTLHFAQRAKLVKNNAVLNEDTCGTVAALQAEVAKLRSQLQSSPDCTSPRNNDVEEEDNDMMTMMTSQSQSDLVSALKGRAFRAEERVLLLEKQISKESKVVNTLKRKVREEAMVRKFKERRLDYLQSSASSVDSVEKEDELNLLREEITSLQKRLENPSAEAIEWKVAYEHMKESLDKNIEKEGIDAIMLEDKVAELEATVERLCAEKEELEQRISELTKSSNETQGEIDSILKEVDRLEAEMISLEEKVQEKDDQCVAMETTNNEAKESIVSLEGDLESAREKALIQEGEYKQLEEDCQALKVKVEELNTTLEGKSTDLLDMEKLNREMEVEMQKMVDEFTKELDQFKEVSVQGEAEMLKLQEKIESLTKENVELSSKIQDSTSEAETQKSTLKEMDDKLKTILKEKDQAVENLQEQMLKSENEFSSQKKAMEDEIDKITKQNASLQSDLDALNESGNAASSALTEKEKMIEDLNNRLEESKKALESLENSMDVETKLKEELEAKISEQQDSTIKEQGDLKSRLEEKESDLSQLKGQMETLERELKCDLERLKVENDEIGQKREMAEEELENAKSKTTEAQSKIESLNKALEETEAKLKEISTQEADAREKAAVTLRESEEALNHKITDLNKELENATEDLTKSRSALVDKADEHDKVVEKMKSQECSISELNNQISALSSEKDDFGSEMTAQVQSLEQQLDVVTKEQTKLAETLEEKNELINTKSEELSNNKKLILELEEKVRSLEKDLTAQVRKEFEMREKLRLGYEEKTNSLVFNVHQLSDENEALGTTIRKLESEIESKANDTQAQFEKENAELNSEKEKLQAMAERTESALKGKVTLISRLEKELSSIKTENKLALKKLEGKISLLESDQLFLKNQEEKSAASEQKAKKELLLQKDRMKLLQREKGTLEYELESLQKSQESLNSQNLMLIDKNRELEHQNSNLQRRMQNIDGSSPESEQSSASLNGSENHVSLAKDHVMTTSPEPFDALSNQMDNMIEKMQSSNDNSPTDMDDSFDEDMFLPNIEDQDNNDVDKENAHAGFGTPVKTDYGVKRQPLTNSNRKNHRTPSRSVRKTPLKSASSKKKHGQGLSANRSNYMVFNNKKLFENGK